MIVTTYDRLLEAKKVFKDIIDKVLDINIGLMPPRVIYFSNAYIKDSRDFLTLQQDCGEVGIRLIDVQIKDDNCKEIEDTIHSLTTSEDGRNILVMLQHEQSYPQNELVPKIYNDLKGRIVNGDVGYLEWAINMRKCNWHNPQNVVKEFSFPAPVRAVMECLRISTQLLNLDEHWLQGTKVMILNRSWRIGIPLSIFLSSRGMCPMLLNQEWAKNEHGSYILDDADIIISATSDSYEMIHTHTIGDRPAKIYIDLNRDLNPDVDTNAAPIIRHAIDQSSLAFIAESNRQLFFPAIKGVEPITRFIRLRDIIDKWYQLSVTTNPDIPSDESYGIITEFREYLSSKIKYFYEPLG